MKKLILLAATISLVACSSTDTGMKFSKQSPRGIQVSDIKKEDRVKAYRAAEKHCAKYSKVPRVSQTINQVHYEDIIIPMRTIKFECIRPSN